MRDKLNIIDSLFSHAPSSSWYNNPNYFDWNRNNEGNYVIVTDNDINQLTIDNNSHKRIFVWLVESPLISPNAYNFVQTNYKNFDTIFTFDKNILELVPNSKLLPIGGCWIKEIERKIYIKNKNVSIISSTKNYLDGHKLRHEVIKKIKNIDIYGNGYKPIQNKIEGLKDYKFSISIENCKKDFYFTEKLIDCFVTGTIPIYWGCPSINNFFDANGIITFNNLKELDDILQNINGEYEKRLESVYKNFELSKKYLVADNLLYEHLKNEIHNFR